MAERISLVAPGPDPAAPREQLLELLDEVWICAEQMVDYYNLSAQTFSLFPDTTELEIRPEGAVDYLSLRVTRPEVTRFRRRAARDARNRETFIPKDGFMADVRRHHDILSPR